MEPTNRERPHRVCRRTWLERMEFRELLAADLQVAHTQALAAEWFVTDRNLVIDQWLDGGQKTSQSAAWASTAWAWQGPRHHVASDWIVQLTPQSTEQVVNLYSIDRWLATDAIELRAVRGLGRPGLVQIHALDSDIDTIARHLAASSHVESYQVNARVSASVVPNDPSFGSQIALENVGQFNSLADADLDIAEAWNEVTGSPSTVVAIIDSGIELTHPDLAFNIWINQREISQSLREQLLDTDGDRLITFYDLNTAVNAAFTRDINRNNLIDADDLLNDPAWADGVDTDRNGFIDDFFGWNFRAGSDEPFAPNNPSDALGHGTHVAGIIGAQGNNARGISGVNWQTSLMSLKFLDQNNQGDIASAIAAFNYATMMRTDFDTNVRVINSSWGQSGEANPQLSAAIEAAGAAGILVVAAAGNGNVLGVGIDNDRTPFYPASYSLDNLVSVAASDRQDQLAAFSNFGLQSVDLAAPGVGILSTLPGGRYGEANGTSMAAPMVSGVAALIWSSLPQATVAEVRQALILGVDSLPVMAGLTQTGARLNAHRAIAADVFAPSATLVTADNVIAGGGPSHPLTVRYFDRSGIDTSTLGDDDLQVVHQWGAPERLAINLQPGSIRVSGDGKSVEATYLVVPPGGSWDPLDFGSYTITTVADAVGSLAQPDSSNRNRSIRQAAIGRFQVRIESADVLIVDTLRDVLDNGENLSLREALAIANADTGRQFTILLDSGRYSLQLPPQLDSNSTFPRPAFESACATPADSFSFSGPSTGDLDVLGQVKIIGDQSESTTIDGQSIDRLFKVHANASLRLERLTLTGGRAPPGQSGGAILSTGKLALNQVTLEGNATSSDAERLGRGGAIAAWDGRLDIVQSRITANQSQIAGGVFWCGPTQTTIVQSLVDGNSNGGLVSYATQDAIVTSSTISTNTGDTVVGQARDFPGGTGSSLAATISRDGRKLAFLSQSDNLVRGDSNRVADTFVYDVGSTAITRVSRSSGGEQASAASEALALSGDGQKVLFLTNAGNLVSGDNATSKDLFVHDIATGNTQLVSASNTSSRSTRGSPGINDDGRWIVFQQSVVGDLVNGFGVFVMDTINASTTRIDLAIAGVTQRIGLLNSTRISGDGRLVTIASELSGTADGNLHMIYLWDQSTGQLQTLPARPTGAVANGSLFDPAMSRDGGLIAFASDDSLLVPGDTNTAGDVYVYEQATGQLQLISRNPVGLPANGPSTSPAISSDGRFVAYASTASDLVDTDTNGQSDIFLWDRASGITQRISRATDGSNSNGSSIEPSISGDGRFIVYQSTASNLVASHPNHALQPGVIGSQIYVYDRTTGTTRPASAFQATSTIHLSASTLAFNTANATVAGNVTTGSSLFAGNLVESDLGRNSTSMGNNILASSHATARLASSDNLQLNAAQTIGPLTRFDGDSPPGYPLIAGSPAIDAASSSLSGQRDQWNQLRAVPDVGALEAITGSIAGEVFADLNANRVKDSNEPYMPGVQLFLDADRDGILSLGEFSTASVSSSSGASTAGSYRFQNVLPGTQTVRVTVGAGWDASGLPATRVGLGTTQGDGPSSQATISHSGRWIAWVSSASNLVSGDTPAPNVFVAARDPGTGSTLSIEKISIEGANPRVLNFAGDREQLVLLRTDTAVYLYDRLTRTTEVISLSVSGQPGNAHSDSASISRDGRWVVFSSFSNNLVPGDTDNFADVFLVDRQNRSIESITVAAAGVRGNDDSENPTISSDGGTIVFVSDANNLVPGDTNGFGDAFAYDRVTRTLRRINVSSSGVQSNGFTYPPVISGNGQFVVFQSMADNLVSGDTNRASDLFIAELSTGRMERLEISFINQPQALQLWPSISDDGQYVAFEATSTNLSAADATGVKNIFVFDRSWSSAAGPATPLLLASQSVTLERSNGASTRAAISGNGQVIVFESVASNLVPGDTNQWSDIFTVSNPFENSSQTVALEVAENRQALHFGLLPKAGSVRGTIFDDVGIDENFDAGDPVLAGWIVYIDGNFNGRRDVGEASTISGSDGSYQFPNVPSYREVAVGVEIPTGWEQVSPKPGSIATRFFLPAAGSVRGRDFAMRLKATTGQSENARIEGIVFRDANADGIQQPGEGAVSGVEVYLDLDGDEVRNFDEPRQSTDAQGKYSFANLGSRNYTVRIILTEGNALTSPIGNRFNNTTHSIVNSSLSVSQPQDVVVDDFDGINGPDIAVALIAGNAIGVKLNDGTGSYQAATTMLTIGPQGVGPTAVASGRLNTNATADLVVANSLNSTISVLTDFIGPGAGTTLTLAVGATPFDVTLADVDRDNDLDIIAAAQSTDVANLFAGQIKLFLNNGNGVFTAAGTYSTGGKRPVALVAKDLNQDGFVDVAVANQGDFGRNSDNGSVAVLLGRPGGQFASAVTTQVGSAPMGIDAGDLNGDGHLDLVAVNFLVNTASILVGNGAGRFSSVGLTMAVGQGPVQVTLADIDADRDADILVSNLKSKSVSILRNKQTVDSQATGALVFEPAENFGVFEFAFGARLTFAVEDLDRSGSLDIALVSSESTSLRVLSNSLVGGSHRLQLAGSGTAAAQNFAIRSQILNPTLDPVASPVNLLEDAALTTIPLTGIKSGFSNSQLSISVTSSNDALVPTPAVIYAAGDSTGRLELTPVTNANGQAVLTIQLRNAGADGGLGNADDGVLTRSVTVNVTAVNDPPQIDLRGNQVITIGSALRSVPGFAANFRPGGGSDESKQTIAEYLVTNDRTDLFLVQPAIDNEGTLRYQPRLTQTGVANIGVQVRDNGGTSSGGVDRSVAQSFQIAVIDLADGDIDFGDAPARDQTLRANDYPTRLADNGARHRLSGVYLGSAVDVEVDGRPDALALGDDLVLDDEDGIQFVTSLWSSLVVPTVASLVAEASVSAKLDAWIDLNQDGDWNDSDEQILASEPVRAGHNLLTFTLPIGVRAGTTFGRFRISSAGGLAPIGLAEDGEVEDYAITILDGQAVNSVSVYAPLIGNHEVLILEGQLLVRAGATTIFTAPSSNVQRIRGLNGAAMALYQVITPGLNLVGRLQFNAATSMSTLIVAAMDTRLSQVATSLTGVGIIDLASTPQQQSIQFTSADLASLNAGNRIEMRLGVRDTLVTDSGWRLDDRMLRQGILVHQYSRGSTVVELVGDAAWQNAFQPLDTNSDGLVTPIDALLIINYLNQNAGVLPAGRLPSFDPQSPRTQPMLDVNGDNISTPLDVLLVINRLNLAAGSGESTPSPNSRRVNDHDGTQ